MKIIVYLLVLSNFTTLNLYAQSGAGQFPNPPQKIVLNKAYPNSKIDLSACIEKNFNSVAKSSPNQSLTVSSFKEKCAIEFSKAKSITEQTFAEEQKLISELEKKSTERRNNIVTSPLPSKEIKSLEVKKSIVKINPAVLTNTQNIKQTDSISEGNNSEIESASKSIIKDYNQVSETESHKSLKRDDTILNPLPSKEIKNLEVKNSSIKLILPEQMKNQKTINLENTSNDNEVSSSTSNIIDTSLEPLKNKKINTLEVKSLNAETKLPVIANNQNENINSASSEENREVIHVKSDTCLNPTWFSGVPQRIISTQSPCKNDERVNACIRFVECHNGSKTFLRQALCEPNECVGETKEDAQKCINSQHAIYVETKKGENKKHLKDKTSFTEENGSYQIKVNKQ